MEIKDFQYPENAVHFHDAQVLKNYKVIFGMLEMHSISNKPQVCVKHT